MRRGAHVSRQIQSAEAGGRDDITGEPLIQRDDDKEEDREERLDVVPVAPTKR